MRSALQQRSRRCVRWLGAKSGDGGGGGVADPFVNPEPADAGKTNKYSATLTQHARRGGAQAMLVPCGVDSEAARAKPQVGIASVWWESNPCNMHLLELSEHVKASVAAEDLVAWRYNTIGVSDAISMGTGGMRYSLQSRDLIADSVETVAAAQFYDGLVPKPASTSRRKRRERERAPFQTCRAHLQPSA